MGCGRVGIAAVCVLNAHISHRETACMGRCRVGRVFHPCCRHDIQTTAAVFYLASSGRSARSSLQSAGGRFRFLVPPSGTSCLSTSHLRRHSRFLDNDSRPFCFPVPTKTLSLYRVLLSQFITTDICGPCNN